MSWEEVKLDFFRPTFYRDYQLEALLLSEKILTEDELNAIRIESEQKKKPLYQFLFNFLTTSKRKLLEIISRCSGFPIADFSNLQLSALNILPYSAWASRNALGFRLENSTIHVAMTDPENLAYQHELLSLCSAALKQEIQGKFYHGDPHEIHQLLKHYLKPQSFNLETQDILEDILQFAIRLDASDIHFQMEEHFFRIKIRIDGMLRSIHTLHKDCWLQICNRLKVLSGLDIAESRRPQSGHFKRETLGESFDFRVSTHPTVWGETLVIRILERRKSLLPLSDLGFNKSQITILEELIQKPYGLLIICGPTGAGKTTTLYSLLSLLDLASKNVVTLEDPVECQMVGVRQTEICEGLIDFADGIRSLLRQDPDVMLVGEVRDTETARMALQASITGHLVLTTLHAYNSFRSLERFYNLGVDRDILTSTVCGVVSQRLVRRLCIECRGEGCFSCFQSGYKGRTTVAEVWKIDEVWQEKLRETFDPLALERYAKESDFFSLEAHAKEKIQKSETDLKEIQRAFGERAVSSFEM